MPDESDDRDYMKGFGALAGTEFAEHVRQAREEIDRDFRKRQRELFGDCE